MAEIKPTSDTFGMSEDFIQKQQEKRQQGKLNIPGTVSAEAMVNEVIAPAPVVETPNISATPSTLAPDASPVTPTAPVVSQTPIAPSQGPATPSTVAPPLPAPTPVTVKEEKPQLIDNKALQFNKQVDENRKQGMNEQQAYQTAMQKLIRPTVSDLRKSGTEGINTPDGRRAKFENDQFRKYSIMSPTQLFTELKNGNLSTKLQTELQSTPAFAEAKTKFEGFKQVDNINANTGALLGNDKVVNPIQTLSDNLTNLFTSKSGTDGIMRFREYISQNPVITQKTSEYNQKSAEKMELERARTNVVKDLKAKYAGLPMSTILAMAGRETEPLNEQINSLNDSLTLLGSEIKQESEYAVQEFEIYQGEIQAQQAKEQKLQEVLANLAISDYQTNKQQAFEAQKIQSAQQFEVGMEQMKNKYQDDREANNYVRDLEKIGVNNFYDLQKMEKDQNFQKQIEAIKNKYSMSRSVQELNNDIAKIGYQFNLSQQSKALDLTNEKEMMDYKASLDPDLAEKWEAVRAKATENSSLADLYGKNVGTYEGNRGYDLAGKLGDAIVAPPGAKVIEIGQLNDDGSVSVAKEGAGPMSKKDPGYGNTVLLQLADGTKMRLSHLESVGVNLGDTLAGGQVLGTRGNTGNVLGKNGEKLTPEQLAAGRGSHVDVEIFDTSGKLLSQSQQLEFLKSVKPFSSQTQSFDYSLSDVERFNNSTFKPQSDLKTKEDKAKYDKFIQDRTVLKQDKNAKVEDIINMSAGGRELAQGQEQELAKFSRALSQLGDIQKQIKETNVGPILGRLSKMNPYDTDAQLLKAQLQGLIPNIARGVYGEVGVLTDADIENYAKTIPNLTSTEDVNNAVLAMTLDILAEGYKAQLATYAAAGRDVSGFAGMYQNLKGQAESIKTSITNKAPSDQKYESYLSKPLY